jgi:PKD repeat protein
MLLAAIAVGSACTVQQASIPDLMGPSGLAESIIIQATPDTISHDGASRSTVVVTAYGPNGQPVGGRTLRLDVLVGGVPVDYGTLSTKTIVTGSDGNASAVYTAPPPPPANLISQPTCSPNLLTTPVPGICVEIVATSIGSSFVTNLAESVVIKLVPVGVILPPADTPVAAFTATPTPVQLNLPANFDASASCGGPKSGEVCSSSSAIQSYFWDFGDGSTSSGRAVSHAFSGVGTFSVTLTVTNDRGVAASTTQAVTVSASAAPTATFVFSPDNPVVRQFVQFNASGSTAEPGRTITQYVWNWGDGETGTGRLQEHDYQVAGAYTVTLTVTDDLGVSATDTKTVQVGTGAPTAVFVVTSKVGLAITVDAQGSSAATGASISTYAWTWGDGTSTPPGASPIGSNLYSAGGTYTVVLTVTDNIGRIGVQSQSVTVP